MANALYALGRQKILEGSIHWLTDDIKVVGVDHGTDTPVPATDEYLAAITAGARIFTSGNLGTKTSTGGTADAADITITAVTGATVESVNVYKDSADPATSPLIAYIDTATGLAFTPNGGDLTIQWDSGANKIFTL